MDLVKPILDRPVPVLELRLGVQRPAADVEHPVLLRALGQPREPVERGGVEHEGEGVRVLLFGARGVGARGPHLVPVVQRALDGEGIHRIREARRIMIGR